MLFLLFCKCTSANASNINCSPDLRCNIPYEVQTILPDGDMFDEYVTWTFVSGGKCLFVDSPDEGFGYSCNVDKKNSTITIHERDLLYGNVYEYRVYSYAPSFIWNVLQVRLVSHYIAIIPLRLEFLDEVDIFHLNPVNSDLYLIG